MSAWIDPLEPGTRVEKINSEFGDGHRDGAQGTIFSLMGVTSAPIGDVPAGTCAYMVLWDDKPETPVCITGTRIRRII